MKRHVIKCQSDWYTIMRILGSLNIEYNSYKDDQDRWIIEVSP